jgi:hypothetical protein
MGPPEASGAHRMVCVDTPEYFPYIAYRTPTPTPFTQTRWRLAAIDAVVAVGCIYLWQALAAFFAPQWLLPARALSGGLPIFCILLFFVRLQAPQAMSRIAQRKLRRRITQLNEVVERP